MDKISHYIENVFYGLPKTDEVFRLKERIRENMEEKYRDLLESGKNEDEAFGVVVAEFGSIEEIRGELTISEETEVPKEKLQEQDPILREEYERFRRKHALAISVGVALILLGVISTTIIDNLYGDDSVYAAITMLFFVMCSVSIFIYFGMMSSRYKNLWKESDDQEEEEKNPVVRTINSVIMTTATVIFIMVGTLLDVWHPTWIIFVIAAATCKVVKCVFHVNSCRR